MTNLAPEAAPTYNVTIERADRCTENGPGIGWKCSYEECEERVIDGLHIHLLLNGEFAYSACSEAHAMIIAARLQEKGSIYAF